MRRNATAVVATVLLFSALACISERNSPTAVSSSQNAATAASTSQSVIQVSDLRVPRDHAQEWSDINASLPGFAGMFYSDSGDLVVLLRDARQQTNSRSVLASYLDHRGQSRAVRATGRGVTMRFVGATYDYSELLAFKHAIEPIAGAHVADIGSLSIDEKANRVRIGVVSDAAESRIRAALAAANVPKEVVTYGITSHVRPTSLQEPWLPLWGGTRLVGMGSSSSTCTLGLPILRRPFLHVTQAGVLTAAHCVTGGVQNQLVQWNFVTSFIDTVAISDVVLGGYSCSLGTCRHSDAVLGTVVGGHNSALGTIAHPNASASPPTWQGTLNFDAHLGASDGPFKVYDDDSSPVVGQYIEKVGQTTGWTEGQVNDACLDGFNSPLNLWITCSVRVAAGSDGGDSGGPVFGIIWPTFTASNMVHFQGILWGVTLDGFVPNHNYLYSTIANIKLDLGSFSTH